MVTDRIAPEVKALPADLIPAPMKTINLEVLRSGDEAEAKKLFNACIDFGFFYLDLREMSEGKFVETVDRMFELDEELYSIPDKEKMLYDVDKLGNLKINGYKPVGRNYGGIKGKFDGFETWALPKNGIMGLNDDEFLHPPVISKNMSTLKTFTKGMNTITDSILGSLSKSLSLPADGTLESYHRPAVPSSDIVRFLKYHAQPASERGAAHTPHTDLGSLTILFTRQPGLQVLPPKSDQWYYVAPRADHAIVNLGDGMATLSNNLFHTCLHRVSPLPNRAMETRYSFAYLQRAEDTTPMTGVKSALIPEISQEKVLTSSEWIQEKFRVLRLNTRRDNEDWVLTGQDRQREGIPV